MKLFILIERFRARLRRLLGRKRKNTRLLIVVIDADEPMKGHMPLVTLKKPIKPGKRRLITLKPDEPVDIRPDGTFVGVGIVSGDSSIKINPESTATEVKVWVNGDGSLGRKEGRLKFDGHVGEGEVEIVVDLEWEVGFPDASTVAVIEPEGEDEDIPIEDPTPTPEPAPATPRTTSMTERRCVAPRCSRTCRPTGQAPPGHGRRSASTPRYPATRSAGPAGRPARHGPP